MPPPPRSGARPPPRRRGRRPGGRCRPCERCSVTATSRPSGCSSYSRPSAKPGLTPASWQRAMTLRRPAPSQAHGELAHHRLLVQRLDAVERGQRLARVVRALQQQLAELDEPAAAQPGEVDDAGQRVERLGGADVRGRLLAADVLLARLQREHEAAAPVDVARLARDAPGHAPQVGLGGGEEAERRAAEVQAVAERLALADGHVDAALARRLEDPQRDRVVGADDDRGRVLGGARQRGGVLDRAEEVGLLEDDRARVLVDGGGPGVGVGDAVAQPDLDDLVAVAGGQRAQRRARVRVHAARDDDPAACRWPAWPGRRRPRRRSGPRRRSRWRPAARSAREIAVWYSNMTCRPPWEISGW